MIEFVEAEPEPKPIREKIILNGEEIGEIWEIRQGWQCRLKTKSALLYVGGVGETRGLAIVAAKEKAVKDIEELKEIVGRVQWIL